MKRIYFKRSRKLILVMIITVFGINSCEKQPMIDPFWEINLAWDKNTVTNMLYEDTKNGEVLNAVFSFEKEFYLKNKEVDAKIHASLEYPDFDQDDLEALSYSLVAKFKNETIPEFNHEFYDYFKKEMVLSYGDITSQYEKDNTIYLNWKIENDQKIKATIIKDINHYNIQIILKS